MHIWIKVWTTWTKSWVCPIIIGRVLRWCRPLYIEQNSSHKWHIAYTRLQNARLVMLLHTNVLWLLEHLGKYFITLSIHIHACSYMHNEKYMYIRTLREQFMMYCGELSLLCSSQCSFPPSVILLSILLFSPAEEPLVIWCWNENAEDHLLTKYSKHGEFAASVQQTTDTTRPYLFLIKTVNKNLPNSRVGHTDICRVEL